MKRRTFVATLKDAAGRDLATAEAYAWNSAVRASEKLARDYAYAQAITLHGDKPEVYGPVGQLGSTYRRTWSGAGHVVRVEVCEVAS